jgi:hypothetical protein
MGTSPGSSSGPEPGRRPCPGTPRRSRPPRLPGSPIFLFRYHAERRGMAEENARGPAARYGRGPCGVQSDAARRSGRSDVDERSVAATGTRAHGCRQGLPGLPWRWHSRPSCCRTGPSPLAVKLIAGHGAWVNQQPRPGCPDAAEARGRAPGWPACRPGAWRPRVIRGRGKDVGRNHPAGRDSGRWPSPGTSRWGPLVRSRLPGRGRVRLPSTSPPCRRHAE